jgi:glycosyltransferase involved in cell wall biosynthesis
MARASASNKRFHRPLRVLFVGRLSREKNVHVLLRALQILQMDGVDFECRIVGTGPMQERLEEQVVSMDMVPSDVLIGALPFEEVLEQYGWADVLVLASQTEGWPKAIAEAMAFGLVCVGSNRGLVPWMLADDRGLLVEPGDENGLASILQQIADGQIDLVSMSGKASNWSQRFSLDGLRDAIRKALICRWHLQDDDLRRIS